MERMNKNIIFVSKEEFDNIDMNDRFIFFSKSAKKKPGKGVGEFASTSYDSLPLDFRQDLSNFGEKEDEYFIYDGYKWKTVEHAFQAAKFKDLNFDLFYSFTIDSNSDLGIKGSGLDAQKKRKSIILNKEQLKEWGDKNDEIMGELWRVKFSQIDRLKKLLLDTKNAELWHTVNRKPIKQRWIGLERIREELRK